MATQDYKSSSFSIPVSSKLQSKVYKPSGNTNSPNIISSSSRRCISSSNACERKEESKENHLTSKLSPRKTEIPKYLPRKRTLSETSMHNDDKELLSTPTQSFKRVYDTFKSSRKTNIPKVSPRKRTMSETSVYNGDKEFLSTPTQGFKRVHEIFKSSRYSLPETSKRALDYQGRQASDRFHHRTFRQSWTQRYSTDQTPYSPYISAKRHRTILPRYKLWNLFNGELCSFIDTHCHLDFLFQRQNYSGTYKSYQQLHKDTYPKNYQGCVAVFCNPFTFAEKHTWQRLIMEENVWAAFGCHPHNSQDYNDDIEESLMNALKRSEVIALGEIGLDYSTRNNCKKDVQHEVFKRQLEIAKRLKLPLVIHCREAHEDGLRILKKMIPGDYRIHLHCFTDTWDLAKEWMDAFPNLFIGITNVVTFPSAETVHDVVKNIPLDRLLLETDAPYFIPKQIGRETRWSHPGMAIHVAGQIAALREISVNEVLNFARKNTRKMYGI